MSKGLSKFMTNVAFKKSDVDGENKLPYSTTCEISGCDTHFVKASNGFPDRHECGLTATTVNDWSGSKRGICAEHYLRGMVKKGKCSNQEMRNGDGSISPLLMSEFQAKMGEKA
jgi:hypothetical protein